MSIRLVYNTLGILIVLALWEVIGRVTGAGLFAPPSVVLVEFWQQLLGGQMLAVLTGSLGQMLVGYGLACLMGLPLGVAMGRSALVDALLHPWVSMLVVTSVAALVPMFILMFGTGFWFRVAIVFIAAVWYIMLTVYQGARGIDRRLLDVGVSFGAGAWRRFHAILLPALYPFVITAMRIGLIHAIRAMVVAEMFIIVGYGGLIYRAGLELTTAPLLALLVALMIVGIAANAVLHAAMRAIAPWYEARMASVFDVRSV